MEITLTLPNALALTGAMFLLAVVPDGSAMAVTARTLASGFAHGLLTVAGIILGDLAFILLAFFGLSALAEMLGSDFVWVRYLAAAYLVWLGLRSLFAKPRPGEGEAAELAQSSPVGSLLTGLFITLSDPKAILFYLSFLPAFLDLQQATLWDAGLILAIAALTISIAKLGYAWLAVRAAGLMQGGRGRVLLNRMAGVLLLATAVYLVL